MKIYDHELYKEDVAYVAGLAIDWERLRNKAFLISGASGNIASFLIDVLWAKDLGIKIYALGRNEQKAKERFAEYWDDDNFVFVAGDINQGINLPEASDIADETFGAENDPDKNEKLSDGVSDKRRIDYIFHAASNTHPKAYSSDPIGTITTNMLGTYHLLEYGAAHGCERFLFASSVEIYGENRGDAETFDESYLGYIDCNTMRAGYPESKRCGEALCQAYIAQKGMDVVIPRLSRTYGPTLLSTDTKAISQFIHKGVAGEDIVLKSEGNQLYSYSYVADAVSALLYCLLYGECGQAYNVADPGSDIALKDLARIVADCAGRQVVFELPDAKEAAGYSTATKAVLDAAKLRSLGWSAHYDMKDGLMRTIAILRDSNHADA